MITTIADLRADIKCQKWKGWRVTQAGYGYSRGDVHASKRWPSGLVARFTGKPHVVWLSIMAQEEDAQ